MILQNGKTFLGNQYMIGLPDDYETSGRRYPLILFFHGIGERGTNLKSVLKYGPLRQVTDGATLSKDFTPIIVHPQVSTGFTKEFGYDVLSYIKSNYRVDFERVHLGWVSMGGQIGWNMVEDANIVREIASFVSICAVSNNPAKANVLVNEGIPGWCAHAPNDKTVPYTNTAEMVEAVNVLAQDELLRFTDVGLFGHSIWSSFLRPEFGVFDWMKYQTLSKRRRVELKKITIFPGDQIIIECKP